LSASATVGHGPALRAGLNEPCYTESPLNISFNFLEKALSAAAWAVPSSVPAELAQELLLFVGQLAGAPRSKTCTSSSPCAGGFGGSGQALALELEDLAMLRARGKLELFGPP